MLVTIFSDASFCPDTRAAGWGGWAKSERGTTSGGGPIVPRPEGVNCAELFAIVEAVRMALNPGAAGAVALPDDHLLIQSDSQGALCLLGWKKRRPDATYEEKKLVAAFRLLTTQNPITLRWVKGHHPEWRTSPRHAVNHTCDREARRHMVQQRKIPA